MQVRQISFNNGSRNSFRQENPVTILPVYFQQSTDKIDISNKKESSTENNTTKSTFEKVSLGILAAATITGIGLFAFRKNIAKKIWTEPKEYYIKPLDGLKDDTLEQAAESIKDKFRNLEFKEKSLEEILALRKYARNTNDFIELASALSRKLYLDDSKLIIQEFEPIINEYFKIDKLDWKQPSHVEALAYAYNKEGMSQKAFDFLLKAEEKWQGQNFGGFKTSLIDLYSSNGEPEKAIKIWENAEQGEIAEYKINDRCLIPIMKDYIELDKTDKAIELYKNYGKVTNEELSDIYVDIMSKEGREKELLKDIFSHPYSSTNIIQLMDRNLSKFKLDDKYNEIITTMAKSLKAEKELPISGWEELSKKNYDNIENILKCTNFLKGEALPDDYADKMINILKEILNEKDSMKASEMLSGLYDLKFESIYEKYPAYQWLKENLTS